MKLIKINTDHYELDGIKVTDRLSEVKELIGELPDPKLIDSMGMRYRHDFGLLKENEKEGIRTIMKQLWEEVVGLGFYKSYNKEKKYTEEDVIRIVEKSRETGLTAEYLMITLQPKTEWEVYFDENGKLKLL